MTPISRAGRSSRRFLGLRIGLFFFGAGTWVAGMVSGRREVTDAAIVILALGLVLGLVARRLPDKGEEGRDEPEE